MRHLLRKSDKEKKELEEKISSITKPSRRQAISNDVSSCEKYEKRDKAMSKNVERQSQAIARLSRELLHLKYGTKEPYYAQLVVGFPESMPGDPTGEITIEFASSELMPTAVLFFMNQIHAGAWDGMAFIRNAGHVLQASQQDVNKKYHPKQFELEMQRGDIPFQEYSDKFPHKKYTLGLAGRPGGPDFYISTVDNTRNHGPGGQGSYDLPAEADSCFAKVVQGFDVVDRMHKAPHEKTSFEALIDYIEIKSFKILSSLP
jgi:cyclophilin family peptidyl-prolyl cis-trans isomerase